MKHFKKLNGYVLVHVFIVFLFFAGNRSHAQSMGISTSTITPDASSILEIRSTNKGLLVPRMTQAQRDAINSGTFASGLIVYNTDTKFFNYYDGTAWQVLSSGSSVVNGITGTTDKITIGGTATNPTVTIASTYLGQTSMTTLGTITTGTWNGTKIAEGFGGTNQSTYTTGDMLYSSAANTLGKLSGNTTPTKKFLAQTGDGTNSAAPLWATISGTDLPNVVFNNQSNTYTAGMKQILQASSTTAGLNFAGTTSDPSGLSNGDIWHNTTVNAFKYRANGNTRTIANLDEAQVLTNKDLSSATNTFPTFNQNTTGTASKATNLVGGNNTTLLGSMPYQSNTDVTTMLAPNTTATKKFLTQTGNGTNGAVPGWNTILAGDIPTLNQNTTGSAATLTTARNIYGNSFNGSADLSGIITSTYGGTGNGFTKFSGPVTSEKTFTLPNASATILTDNTAVTVPQGGTGFSSYTIGDMLYANATSTLGKLSAVATGNALLSGGTGTAPLWGKIGLTTHVSGILPVANGGTNSSTSLNNNRIMVSSGSAIVESSALTNGQLLIGSTGAAPVAANLTAGNGITITNNAGGITIAGEPTITQATATADVTTTSTTDVLLTGMTITPGAGDYLVSFTGSLRNSNANKQGPVSIYSNGTQIAASVVNVLGTGNSDFSVATQAYITGLAAGQAIEVRWSVLANTGTFHQRTFIVQKVK